MLLAPHLLKLHTYTQILLLFALFRKVLPSQINKKLFFKSIEGELKFSLSFAARSYETNCYDISHDPNCTRVQGLEYLTTECRVGNPLICFKAKSNS